MKIFSKNSYTLLFISICILGAVDPCFAADIAGEIININPSQSIAFIDLGKDSIAVGDIFSVDTSSTSVYLEVIETASAVSKLGICQKENFKSSVIDFQSVSIGAAAKRVMTNKPATVRVTGNDIDPSASPMPTGIPNIDPQVLVKPNIANETIQSLDTRLDKMVESNVKLFNTLTELLNEKKQRQVGEDQIRADLQTAQAQIQTLNLASIDLKKQLAEANFQTANAVAENEKNKRSAQDAQARLQSLKTRLESLNKIIQDRLKQ